MASDIAEVFKNLNVVQRQISSSEGRSYLGRMTGDDRLADDLLQETYYKFLRSNAVFESDDHRRHYLFRIATNLVHDHRRRPRVEVAVSTATQEAVAAPVVGSAGASCGLAS